MSTTEVLAWVILAGGLLLGALGTVVPGLPGAAFVVAGVLGHKWLMPDVLSWWSIGVVSALAAISWITDLAAGLLGARWGGATRMGLIGAAIGGFVGIFVGLPGLILGPFFGAIIGDILAARRDGVALLKSGGGAAAGFLISLIVRLALLALMAVVIATDLLI